MTEQSPIPWLAPEEHQEWKAAYGAELAAGPDVDDGMVLRRAAERTAHLWGVRIAPDGTTVINPDRWAQADLEPEAGG